MQLTFETIFRDIDGNVTRIETRTRAENDKAAAKLQRSTRTSHRAVKTPGSRGDAIEYGRWLAARDGIALPETPYAWGKPDPKFVRVDFIRVKLANGMTVQHATAVHFGSITVDIPHAGYDATLPAVELPDDPEPEQRKVETSAAVDPVEPSAVAAPAAEGIFASAETRSVGLLQLIRPTRPQPRSDGLPDNSRNSQPNKLNWHFPAAPKWCGVAGYRVPATPPLRIGGARVAKCGARHFPPFHHSYILSVLSVDTPLPLSYISDTPKGGRRRVETQYDRLRLGFRRAFRRTRR